MQEMETRVLPYLPLGSFESNQPTYIATRSDCKVLLSYKLMQRNGKDDEQEVSKDRKDRNPIGMVLDMCF